MHQASTWRQTGAFDPSNPNQRAIERYAMNGYHSFYFNRVPTTAALQGVGGLGTSSLDTLPTWAQVGLAVVGAAAAYGAYKTLRKGGHLKFIGLGRVRTRRQRSR